jgi:hypothetical protein
MIGYESPGQEHIVITCQSDAALQTLLGGDGTDKRVLVGWARVAEQKLSTSKPGFVAVDVFEPASFQPDGNVYAGRERIGVRLYTLPQDRALRWSVVARLRALFNYQSFDKGSFDAILSSENDVGQIVDSEGFVATTYFIDLLYHEV